MATVAGGKSGAAIRMASVTSAMPSLDVKDCRRNPYGRMVGQDSLMMSGWSMSPLMLLTPRGYPLPLRLRMPDTAALPAGSTAICVPDLDH